MRRCRYAPKDETLACSVERFFWFYCFFCPDRIIERKLHADYLKENKTIGRK